MLTLTLYRARIVGAPRDGGRHLDMRSNAAVAAATASALLSTQPDTPSRPPEPSFATRQTQRPNTVRTTVAVAYSVRARHCVVHVLVTIIAVIP